MSTSRTHKWRGKWNYKKLKSTESPKKKEMTTEQIKYVGNDLEVNLHEPILAIRGEKRTPTGWENANINTKERRSQLTAKTIGVYHY